MPEYKISSCSVADAEDFTQNNIPAFWEDSHWVLDWRHRTLEYHLTQVALRMPMNIINNCEKKRLEKATDPATGRFLGSSRWFLPASHARNADGSPAWPEAVVAAVGPEEEAEIRRIAKTAVWDPKGDADVLVEPMIKAKKEFLARKDYLGARDLVSII